MRKNQLVYPIKIDMQGDDATIQSEDFYFATLGNGKMDGLQCSFLEGTPEYEEWLRLSRELYESAKNLTQFIRKVDNCEFEHCNTIKKEKEK